MSHHFNEEEKIKIKTHFGQDFYLKVRDALKFYRRQWQIETLQLVHSFSANLVFKGTSKCHGPIVIKFSTQKQGFIWEVQALNDLSGPSMCRLIAFESKALLLLEEGASPGTPLKNEGCLETRLDIFCRLFKALHLEKKEGKGPLITGNTTFQTYTDWVERMTDYMQKKDQWSEVTPHMNAAASLCHALTKTYNQKCLLHGDLHYYNIVKSSSGYKIIDPKGVLGDPIFDLPRYLLNEFWDAPKDARRDIKMDKVMHHFHQELGIPLKVLCELLYIEGSLAICWCIESGADLSERETYLLILDKLFMYLSRYQ